MIYEFLEMRDAIGKHSAISSAEIIRALHLENTRELRKIAAAEHLLHRPLLAGDTGYFLSKTETDVTSYVKRLRGQAAAIDAVADAMERMITDGE